MPKQPKTPNTGVTIWHNKPLNPIEYWERQIDQKVAGKSLDMFRQAVTQRTVLRELEERVEYLVAARHDYPIWPHYGVPSDAMEKAEFEPIRHNYYRETIFLIRILRLLRKVK